MSKLFTGYKLRDMDLKNRIVMAPMCMYSADTEGNPSDWHFTHYTSRAVGGVGLIILEATAVEARGRISDRDLGLWNDDHIEGLKKIVDACHGFGAKMGIQLAHAGRKSEVSGNAIIAPSPIRFSDKYNTPLEMTIEDINTVISSFRESSRRANEAGFDTIEIHGAHGYLISEFLSPITNQRNDQYGGCEVNRVRFLKEILQEMRKVWPSDKPIIVRISAEDYAPDGNHPHNLAIMLNEIKDCGVDAINVSSGGVYNVVPKVYPGYQIKMAEIIREMTGMPVISGGLISAPELAEEIIQNNRADLIFIGRELLRNPYWPINAAKELKSEVHWPTQYPVK